MGVRESAVREVIPLRRGAPRGCPGTGRGEPCPYTSDAISQFLAATAKGPQT